MLFCLECEVMGLKLSLSFNALGTSDDEEDAELILWFKNLMKMFPFVN